MLHQLTNHINFIAKIGHLKRNKIIVDAEKSGSFNMKELWEYKDLLRTLAYRDYRVKYAQTFLGLSWAIIQPVLTIAILSVVFGRALNIDTNEVPYSVFALSGMVSWSFFSYVISHSGQSIISSQEMVKKIYFPRLIIPLSKAVTGFIDLLINLLILLILMLFFSLTPSVKVLFMPVFLLITIVSSLSVGIWLSALTIRYRDLQHIIPFMVQIGLYISPVAYPSSLIPEKYQWLYFLNPAAGAIEGFRWCVFKDYILPLNVIVSYSIAIILFVTSIIYFKKIEGKIADIV